MRHPHRYNRRDFLKAVGIMGAGSLLAACGPTGAPPAPEAAPEAADSMAAGEKYDGVTLRMLTQAGGDYEPAFRAWAEDFTAETGAQVEFEFAPWESLMPKVQADLASGSPRSDLFATTSVSSTHFCPSWSPSMTSGARGTTWKASSIPCTGMAKGSPGIPASAMVCQ